MSFSAHMRMSRMCVRKCYKPCEMLSMEGGSGNVMSNTWRLFKTDQHVWLSVTFTTLNKWAHVHSAHTHRDEHLQVAAHFVTFVFVMSIITKQVVNRSLWRLMWSQWGISHFAGVGWVTELSSCWHAEDLPVKKAGAVLVILIISGVVVGNSYQRKQFNPKSE